MWNLEKWYRRLCLQGRNRDTDAENKRMDTKGRRGGGMNWETGIDVYTLMCIKQITNKTCCMALGTALRCTVETNTTL